MMPLEPSLGFEVETSFGVYFFMQKQHQVHMELNLFHTRRVFVCVNVKDEWSQRAGGVFKMCN